MTLATYKWTVANYHQAIEAGLFVDAAVELLRGNLVVMAPEREPHAYYTRSIGHYLQGLLGDRALVSEAHPITLPDNSEPEPDVAIVQPLGREYLNHHPHPENIFWLIECAQATLTKDLTEKKSIYAEAGIQEYWVIDLQHHQLIVFKDLQNASYTTEQTLKTGLISPLRFPDVAVSVDNLLA
ncbi:Uma2 family endonuclease [Synechococcus sp. BDU 130192]|uniref:Uma2 family endonuclease n=1 Tax=Synechococcus sp. BDU 130192 TaxID=2042059 RepID=UPI000C075606|nr:Uma2 family endonuclease [Synechococcus sp. BDU 130192]